MRSIADFIETIESEKHNFDIWIYSSEGHYCQFDTQRSKPGTLQLQKAIEQNLQVIVEMHNDEIDNVFLLLPEVQVVVPVKFRGNKVLSITRPQAASILVLRKE